MDPIRTPLCAAHERRGARMVNFAGWWMPVQYGSMLDEARRVRAHAGLFDLCHMGRVRIRGKDPVELVDRLVTCDVRGLAVGAIRYGLLTREDGTILDDVLVYREPGSVFLCINAGNRNRDLAWLRTHAVPAGAAVEDLTDALAMISIQGPKSVAVARALCDRDPATLKYYNFFTARFAGISDVMVSRTGYTGEDGFELYFDAREAQAVWDAMLDAGKEHELSPIGLGARDTLRLEAGMPLYGHEIDDTTTPLEAGLMWAVRPRFGFVGGDALQSLVERGVRRRLVGFTCADKRVPRQGYTLYDGDDVVGDVRSGAFSPVLSKNCGTAYVASDRLDAKRSLHVDLRGDRAAIEITALPFYRRKRVARTP